MSDRADKDTLNLIHKLYAQYILKKLQAGEELTASEQSVVIKFLRDNFVQAGIGNGDVDAINAAMSGLESLPLDGEVPEEFKRH